MEKTILEQRIIEKAEERYQKEYNEMIQMVRQHPILGRLTIEINDRMLQFVNFGTNLGMLNGSETNENSVVCNIAKVKETLIEKYKKEETDSILNKLENISYLFNQ